MDRESLRHKTKSGYDIDRISLRILEVLQRAARTTFPKLAQQVGLSASPCFVRVRKLEESGVISGYFADLDLEVLTSHTIVFVTVVIEKHDDPHAETFHQVVNETPEVVTAYQVSGGFDYLLQIVCRDVAHYQEVAQGLLAGPARISKLESHIVFQTIKGFSGYPIRKLIDPPIS